MSVLAEYKLLVEPPLRAAGFEGKTTRLQLNLGRGQFLAHVGRSGADLQAGLSGTDGRSYFIFASTHFAKKDPASVLAKKMGVHVKEVKKALARIGRMDLKSAPRPKTLADAMLALLGWLAKDSDFRKLDITKVVAKGRAFDIFLRGRTRPIHADRAAIVGLLRDLRGGKLAARGRDLRYALHGEELDAYIAMLAKKNADEARALWVHLCSPYDLPAKNHVLAPLFKRPLFATKSLNEGASAGAVLLRALPHTKKGEVVDRVAAIYIVGMTLSSSRTHRKASEIADAVKVLIESLERDRSPLLRDCALMLAPT